jgi:hypothetical protein
MKGQGYLLLQCREAQHLADTFMLAGDVQSFILHLNSPPVSKARKSLFWGAGHILNGHASLLARVRRY